MLYLLPNLLDPDSDERLFLPAGLPAIIETLDGFIVETPKEARKYLKRFKTKLPLQALPMSCLNEHTKDSEITALLDPIRRGQKWGLLVDAGLPCIADPGAKLVRAARRENIEIIALSGPSSIVFALMLSGLSGQNFAFHGYLPYDEKERKEQLSSFERNRKMTHIFMETPYRTRKLFSECLEVLRANTLFSIAQNITSKEQYVACKSIEEWKKSGFIPSDVPSIFLVASDQP
jgi:16S rRNA (cytidine1402-2'-O)-methyltransferase